MSNAGVNTTRTYNYKYSGHILTHAPGCKTFPLRWNILKIQIKVKSKTKPIIAIPKVKPVEAKPMLKI